MILKSHQDPHCMDLHRFGFRIRIRIEIKSCIRICIGSNADPQHWFTQHDLLIHTFFLHFQPIETYFPSHEKKADRVRYKS
jgi:hypothetical protein